MIVYNVKRRWFTMKNDAEAFRKAEGLPPSATYTLRIESRDELAALLNGLTALSDPAAPKGTFQTLPMGSPEDDMIQRNQITDTPPDCVPLFLVREWENKRKGIYK
ncbi:hypothetical protein [Mesorhizobium sp.]|uniref:hypothetical protein n=1 Tax=Mesorhizobium sp. TaxID=1871066 RepID=UPI000FE87873|nr:hypothetical protein [Mesorhizobium sp.]RWM84289.1 MAG: hypothetical protein EOR83_16840 [Mesorhizobium sp.]